MISHIRKERWPQNAPSGARRSVGALHFENHKRALLVDGISRAVPKVSWYVKNSPAATISCRTASSMLLKKFFLGVHYFLELQYNVGTESLKRVIMKKCTLSLPFYAENPWCLRRGPTPCAVVICCSIWTFPSYALYYKKGWCKLATKSVLKIILIKDRRSANSLVAALENASGKKSKEVTISQTCRELGTEEIKSMFGEKTGIVAMKL